MDIIFLLERLESQIATGTGVPGTRKTFVDRDAILELIDQLRVAIPEEVQAAKRINAEGERILEKAQEEATRIVSRAQEQAAFLISERGLTEGAEAEGRQIVAAAEVAGREVADGADSYATQVLVALQTEVEKTLAAIHKGIGVLDDRQAQLRGGRGGASPANGANGAGAEPVNGHDDEALGGEATAEEVGSRSSPLR